MKRLIGTLLLVSIVSYNVHAQFTIATITCENKSNPTGVPLDSFHFGWQLQSTARGQAQSAWQIVIASSETYLQTGKYDTWNSAIVHTAQSIMVPYGGKKLQPGHTYYWKLRVWDKNNSPSAWSAVQSFTTGLFTQADW